MDHTLGVASPATLEADQVLYHGTLANEFVHRFKPYPIHYKHPHTPDEPAWFANNEKFALHAAVRYTKPEKEAEIVLHTFHVYGRIHLMSLPDIENFRIFMQEQFQVYANVNGLMKALPLARRSIDWMGLDGYALLQDAVRGEPEYVLFVKGLSKLRAKDPRVVKVVPIDKTRSMLWDTSTGTQLGIYTYDDGPGALDWTIAG